mmetsp:Transcript_147170/g.472730  ORF Transcript_147170/g.472730 Transcript_147170/m.472730 type:complete len:217 (+) Transcript_147170:130-780(+)
MVMPPASSKCTGKPPTRRQSAWPAASSGGFVRLPSSSVWSSSANSVGTANKDVPVSTTARQVPSSQKSTTRSPMRMRVIWTIQCPSSGSTTGAQVKSPRTCAGECPPKEISLTSSSLSARKTPKLASCSGCCLASMPNMLNSGEIARLSKPRPTMPSNENAWKGSWDISEAVMIRMSAQCGGRTSMVPLAAREGSSVPAVPSAAAVTPSAACSAAP